jgi:hypothetical protein
MGVSGGPDMIQDGLVLSLDASDQNSYPGSGTTWTDLSGNSNTGTLTNGPTFNSANGGNIVFDGTNDFVDCGNGTSINITNNVSVNIWFKITAVTINYQGIIAKRNAVTNNTNYGINFNNSLFQLYYNTSGTFRILNVNYSSYFTTNKWYNVFGTLAQNSTSTDAKMYLNSSLIASSTLLENITTATTNLIIGGSVSSDEFFNGSIGNTQIYNRVLSATEVQQNYNAQKSRFGLI